MKSDELLVTIGEAREYYLQSARDSREQGMQAHKRPSLRHALLIAAIIGLMLLLMGSTVMVMRLQDLTIREEPIITEVNKPIQEDSLEFPAAEIEVYTTVPPTDFNGEEINPISIQGYMGSNSYAAFKEWQEFLETYDPDKSILYANDKTFQYPEAYISYLCYSQEMIDKIAEICEKYNLQPLGKYWILNRGEDVFRAVGIESAFSGSKETGFLDFSGYCFRDGSFNIEGRLELTGLWEAMVMFDYRSVKKTSFDDVARNIGDVSKWDQWNYTMKDGTQVLLALREEGALIIVDKEDSFVTVSAIGTVVNGNYLKFPTERAFLETLCEAFDFTYETKPVDPAVVDALYQAQLEREARGERDYAEYQLNYDYPDTYAGQIDFMVKEKKYTGLNYALIDMNGDGIEELLLQCVNLLSHDGNKNSFFAIYTMKDGKVYHVYSVKMSNLYLCEGGVFDNTYRSSDGHDFFKLGTELTFLESVGHNPQTGLWHVDEDNIYSQFSRVEITEEEAKAIIAKYPRVDIEFRPVSEFPRQ